MSKQKMVMKKIFLRDGIKQGRFAVYVLIALAGFILGGLVFHSSGGHVEKKASPAPGVQKTIWTCSMHPQIRMDKPGKCPICGMDLIPLTQNGDTTDMNAVHLTRESAALANVMTSVVSMQSPVREVRLYGKAEADERLLQSQVSYFSGRIEKLYVNFTGETIHRGQPLAVIFSPDLVTAQQELLEAAATKQQQPEIYEAAREKLRQMKLTEAQIDEIEKTGKTTNDFEVVATTSGIITSRLVDAGQYVSLGTVLFQVADLSQLWIVFDAYENDLPFIRKGQKVTFTVQAIPGREFAGSISFIDPVLDPVTRVAKVRVETTNTDNLLKPEMFVTGIISAGAGGSGPAIVIPASAVLWTGKRSVVYVRKPGTEEPVFNMREIVLGPSLGDSYVVENGLSEGEEIVTRGTFSVDAAAQLEGKPSMMNH